MEVAAIILGVVGFSMGLVSLLIVLYIRGKVDVAVEFLRACLEAKEAGKVAEQPRRTHLFADASDQPASIGTRRSVPTTPPQAIAPKLKSPPKIPGGFGQRTENSGEEEASET